MKKIQILPCLVWLLAFVASAEDSIKEYWGAEKNGIKAGLYVYARNDTNGLSIIRCDPAIASPLTNGAWVWFPPSESMHLLALTDEKGNPVQAKDKLKELGQPLTKKMFGMYGLNIQAGYSAGILKGGLEWPWQIGGKSFLLNDYFVITNVGTYHLTYTMKIIKLTKGWKGSLSETTPPMISLPAVSAEIDILQTNSSAK